MAQSVEHILGKDEVTSSILVTSSKGIAHSQETVDGHFGFFKQKRKAGKIMQQRKQNLSLAVAYLAGCLLLWLAAVLTVRNFGGLLGGLGGVLGEDTAVMLSEIFGQLRDAQLRMGVVPMCGIMALYVLLLLRVRRRAVRYALLPLFAAAAYLCAVLFARVNDVLFLDIIRSLAEMAGRGLFDIL